MGRERRALRRQQKRRRLPEKIGGLRGLLVLFFVTVVLVFGVVRPFVLEVFYVPTESMVPTLLVGERVVANKFIYHFVEPTRGDVITFRAQTADGEEVVLVKRVIGLPEDVIEIQDGVLILNGVPQKEPYVNQARPDRSTFSPIQVPRDHYFVMGDNRTNSADSRVFGPVPEEQLIGKVFLRVWPPNRLGIL